MLPPSHSSICSRSRTCSARASPCPQNGRVSCPVLCHVMSKYPLFLTAHNTMIASCLRAPLTHRLSHLGVVLPPILTRGHTRTATRSLTTGPRKMQTNGSTQPSRPLPDRPDLQISESQDDAALRSKYRPFLLDERVAKSDWISKLELDAVEDMVQADLAANNGERLRVLVLYGSLRARYHMLPYARSHNH